MLDSLEPWRLDIAEALTGGEPVVREALDAYLRYTRDFCARSLCKVQTGWCVYAGRSLICAGMAC